MLLKNNLGFSIWIYVFGFSQCNGLINNVLPATAVATESQSSILTSVVNVSRNADETFIISLRFPNRPEKDERKYA